MEFLEGTTIVKSAKFYVCKGKFDLFVTKKDESVPDMFNRLNEIVNEPEGLGFNVLVREEISGWVAECTRPKS
jgi:hypothetical protein